MPFCFSVILPGVERLGRIQRIVPVFIVAVGELVSVRAMFHHDALGHEFRVERGGRRCIGNARNRERQHRLVAFPCDGGFT